MSDALSVEIEHCKELVMPPGSLFEVSSRFLDEAATNKLMSLYALRQSIGSIPLGSVDDTVKWAKLKWWSEELSADPAAAARHPVVRALFHSGARKRLDNQQLKRLVGDAIAQIDVFPDADRQVLFDRLTKLGETDIVLEMALFECAADVRIQKSMGLAMGAYGFVSMLLYDYVHKVELLPLDILAEFQESSAGLKCQPPSVALTGIVKALAGQGLCAYRSGFAAVSEQSMRQIPLHLRLRWHLEARRLDRIVKSPASHFGKRSAYGPSDVWFAWRYCRNKYD